MQSATISHLRPTKSTQLIAECRTLASARLPDSLKTVLNRVDDTLFELANAADNSNRQNLYFDAMRELRQKRAAFETTFMQSFHTNFENSTDLDKIKHEEQAFEFGSELALVDADEVEQSLAVTHLAESMRSHYREELFALDKRIGVLLRVPDLVDDDNPLGPKAIGDALRQACQCLESDVEIKLTLFKLFEKIAGHAISELYHDINQRLVACDVLPQINAHLTRPEVRKRKTRVIIESEQDSVEAAGEDVFSTLQNLMQGYAPAARPPGSGPGANAAAGIAPQGGRATAGGGSGRAQTGSGPVSGPITGGSAVTGSAPFVQTLTVLQRGAGGGEGSNAVWNHVDPDQVAAGNVNVLHRLQEAGGFPEMGQTDAMTLDIVSLLFDYILEDPAIPDALKALIGRLQIPVLKVAILDKGLFSKKTHPARRLLDELAGASIGWSEGLRQQDAFYDKVEHTVRRVVMEFDDDVALFEEVLIEFLAFLDSEASAAEERTKKSTQSLSIREQVVRAKTEVDEEIRSRSAAFEVREFVGDFIMDYWRQLLIITLVESGRDADAWRSQLEVVDDLVWSVQPKTTPADRKALTARLPRLIKGIKNGMHTLEMEPAYCSRFLSMLASVHVVSIKNVEEASIAERKLVETEARLASERAQAEAAGEVDPTSEEFIKKGLARLFERQDVGAVELDIDFSLFEPEQGSGQGDEPETADATIMEYIAQVTALDLGDWIEFGNDDGTTMRARFTWISPNSGRYLFTTRQGKKALDTDMQGLAEQFRLGRAKVIESAPDPLFDRAIGDLLEKLDAGDAAH
jgi:hypothetical protein